MKGDKKLVLEFGSLAEFVVFALSFAAIFFAVGYWVAP